MMILLYGMIAVVWVVTMILACWLMLNWDPNTAAMPRWKRWLTGICMWAIILYTLPLLIAMLMFEGICYISRRL